MITRVTRACPCCLPVLHYTLAIEHDRRLSDIYGCEIVTIECEHRIVIERIADDNGALFDFLRDAYPKGVEYDGPMYAGEGLGDPREYSGYREAMRDAGRRW